MRQAGVLAAAGLYALDHNVARLAEDHARARALAAALADCPRVSVDLATVETNIVLARAAARRAGAGAWSTSWPPRACCAARSTAARCAS